MAELVGVDVGGTFTDVIAHNTVSGRTCIHKVPTTPHDPSVGVLEALRSCAKEIPSSLRKLIRFFMGLPSPRMQSSSTKAVEAG